MPPPAGMSARVQRWSNWIGFLCYASIAVNIFRKVPTIGVLMLPSFLHEALIGISFLIRRPLRRTASGVPPRLTAYLATFLLPIFFFIAGNWCPQWIAVSSSRRLITAGLVLWLAGSLAGLWTLWSLRRSFSLVPQARALVTSGPYALVRHPIYAAYILQYFGLWIGRPTLPFAMALLVWLGTTVLRMRFEEQVLQAEFPEYDRYHKKAGALFPRLFRASSQPTAVVHIYK